MQTFIARAHSYQGGTSAGSLGESFFGLRRVDEFHPRQGRSYSIRLSSKQRLFSGVRRESLYGCFSVWSSRRWNSPFSSRSWKYGVSAATRTFPFSFILKLADYFPDRFLVSLSFFSAEA